VSFVGRVEVNESYVIFEGRWDVKDFIVVGEEEDEVDEGIFISLNL
jgi:hypothetical protein